MIKERILIIGSTSGLAIELIKRLKVKFKIYKISRKEVNALKNYESYGNYIKKIRPKIVINCIVASGIDFCEENQSQAYILNTFVPIFLSNICSKFNSKFIHFSTEAVFHGKIKGYLYSENSKPNPTTVYGKTKHLADLILSKKNNTLILRVPMLFGPTHNRQLTSKLLVRLLNNKVIYVAKDVYTTPLYIPFVADFVYAILLNKKKYFTKKSKKIINLSSNVYLSLYEFMKEYAKILGKETK